MDSTPKPDQAGTHDLLPVRGDEKPRRDYEEVVREELARVQERLAKLAPAAPSAAAPPEVKSAPAALDANVTAFRPSAGAAGTASAEQQSPRRGTSRFLSGMLVTFFMAGAGVAWSAYGDALRPTIAAWTPQVSVAWSQVAEKLGLSGDPTPPTTPAPTQAASAEPIAPQASAPPETAAAASPEASPTAAPAPADVTQLLQGMARDIAALEQGIEQLKASQEQITRDNAKLAEQLRANQEQMTRMMARTSEPNLRPKPPAPPPRPVAAVRRPIAPPPISTLPPPQTIAPAAAQAAAPPAQVQADDMEIPGVGRPPRPVP
jgi:hypothetical protein